MNQSKIRKVGDGLGANNSSWTFKGKVAKSFDDHFAKSVPFCKEGQKLVTQISDFFIKKNSICYEIGCSTGTLTKMISLRHKEKKTSEVYRNRY